MNKFTKEELQIMHIELKRYIGSSGVLKVPEHVLDLESKLETMIDNYCEPCPSAHEFYDRLVCEQCGLVEGF